MSKPLHGQPLSPAESALLRYLTQGYTVVGLAQRLGTHAATVHRRAARARRKLGATTLDHAVQLYAQQQTTPARSR
ncbi:LuxR C-terminal-related transcriptional regulator [Kitasatospora sp. NPDC057198]|uniref:LuxR C-terminal-related transcriptional regulator n=1 Tax=Kitasatospora sp. NPDC057198 TaxID=3346046 RepID=UPI00362DDCB0